MNERVFRSPLTPLVGRLPEHLAIIMDGNGRWAKCRYLPRIAGHKAGLETARKIIRACGEYGIKVLTLFAFSSENWQRPQQEVQGLMQLFLTALKNEVSKLHKNNVQLRLIGSTTRLNQELREAIVAAENLTANNTGLILVVAIDYGGQWDIVQAAQSLGQKIADGKLSPSDITAEIFQKALSTSDLPLPDLLIRTSGEKRISNFLLWQLAYAELYFTDIYWPDFNLTALKEALVFYASAERRFGNISEVLVEDVAHA